MTNELSTMIECTECKKSIKADANSIKVMKVEDEDNTLTIVYVDCQFCGRRHYVQIDNEESSRLKVRNLIMFKKLAKRKLSDKKIGKSDSKLFENLRKQLSDLRTELMKEYEGQIVTDTLTGETVTLHFTLC